MNNRQHPVRSSARQFAAPLGLYLLFVALLILRRPDCITHSQFWAEDGARFFPQAFERPLWVNLFSYAYGYFDFLLRFMHQTAALFPLEQAPRFLAVCAIVIQAAVPIFIVSRRTEAWLGAFPVRFVAALLYCAMPNSFEVHGIALHSRVHLAVLASLIVVSRPSVTWPGKIFDKVTLVLSALSGPFVFVLAPVAFWRYAQARFPARKHNAAILLAALLVTLFAVFSSGSPRFNLELGVSVQNFARILGGQLMTSFFLGQGTYALMLGKPWFDAAVWTNLTVLVLLLAFLLRESGAEIRCLLLIGFGLLAIALISPLAAVDRSQWLALWSVPGCGQRYYLPVMAMLFLALAALVGHSQKRWPRLLGICLLLLIAGMGARVDFVLPPFTDFHFRTYAEYYAALPPAASLTIPINPPGWEMQLRKPAP